MTSQFDCSWYVLISMSFFVHQSQIQVPWVIWISWNRQQICPEITIVKWCRTFSTFHDWVTLHLFGQLKHHQCMILTLSQALDPYVGQNIWTLMKEGINLVWTLSTQNGEQELGMLGSCSNPFHYMYVCMYTVLACSMVFSHVYTKQFVVYMLWVLNGPRTAGIRTRDLPISRPTLYHWANSPL